MTLIPLDDAVESILLSGPLSLRSFFTSSFYSSHLQVLSCACDDQQSLLLLNSLSAFLSVSLSSSHLLFELQYYSYTCTCTMYHGPCTHTHIGTNRQARHFACNCLAATFATQFNVLFLSHFLLPSVLASSHPLYIQMTFTH